MQTNQPIRVFDSHKSEQILGKLIGAGGEGSVYQLANRPDLLIKCYHPEKLAKQGMALRQKVDAMVSIKDQMICQGADQALSWPLMSVFDQQQKWIGYAMKRADGVPMSRLAQPMLYKKKFPNITRLDVVSYLIRYLDIVQMLHEANVMVGDFNLNNVMLKPGTHGVTLIDCDSFQVHTKGQWFSCPVGSPDMTPPEHHGHSFEKVHRTLESEYFSIAIVLFKCLMMGRHPYDIVGGDDPVKNLRSGKFAYGIGNKGVPVGCWYAIWSHMPHRLKTLFISVFSEGAKNPSKRPNLQTWRKALVIYRNEMAKGWHETACITTQPKLAKYQGEESMSGQLVSLN